MKFFYIYVRTHILILVMLAGMEDFSSHVTNILCLFVLFYMVKCVHNIVMNILRKFIDTISASFRHNFTNLFAFLRV